MNCFSEIVKAVSQLVTMDSEKYSRCKAELYEGAETRGHDFKRFVDALFSVADDMRSHA